MLYYNFKIDEKEYKCKLTMKALVALENKMGIGIYEWLSGLQNLGDGKLPPVDELVAILEESLRFELPNITTDETYDILQKYLDMGHIVPEFFEVITEILQVSGIIPKETKKKSKN